MSNAGDYISAIRQMVVLHPYGRLIARWDTAPHHLTLPTFPHHVHDGAEENIQPHVQVSVADVLALVTRRFQEAE